MRTDILSAVIIIGFVIVISIQYTLNLILRELRLLRRTVAEKNEQERVRDENYKKR